MSKGAVGVATGSSERDQFSKKKKTIKGGKGGAAKPTDRLTYLNILHRQWTQTCRIRNVHESRNKTIRIRFAIQCMPDAITLLAPNDKYSI